VQGELEAALARIVGEGIALTVAGRTDAGVHATAQVASFETTQAIGDSVVRSLNAVLPDDVAVRECAEAPAGFDARRDAKARAYRYRILARRTPDPFERGRALWWRHRVDRAALDACAEALPGTHDFTAFTPTETEHVRFERVIHRAAWVGEVPGVLSFEIEADAFMRHMVRSLVGTMLEVSSGGRTVEDFLALLAGAPRERGGETAPPHGLYLVGVRY
jgi:tRNA pseudouridine38-40 synthase